MHSKLQTLKINNNERELMIFTIWVHIFRIIFPKIYIESQKWNFSKMLFLLDDAWLHDMILPNNNEIKNFK